MEKYCFNVYMNDNSLVQVVPTCLSGVGSELSDYDRYASEKGSFLSLSNSLALECGIDASLIKSIKIYQKHTDLEFSLVLYNPYLNPVLNSVSKKTIIGYNVYPYEGMVVDSYCSQFIEMKDYLFKQIEKDYNIFSTDVYTYKNEFKTLLSQYVDLYKQGILREDQMREIKELKSRILNGLSIYKNYRGLCKARYEYENGYRFTTAKRSNEDWKTQVNIQPKIPEFDPSKFPQEPIYETNQFVNDLGEEREEFLEFDELESEDCYGKRR